MSSKNLIISFVTVSIISLAVSAFAIITVARSYSQRLDDRLLASQTEHSQKDSQEVSGTDSFSDSAFESEPLAPETEHESNTESEITEESISADATENHGTVRDPSFILSIKGERLTVSDSDGNIVYERIIDVSDIRENDLELLRSGIFFSDSESAIGAIYDLIS